MKYKIRKSILWKKIDDEVVIVDPDRDDYSYLNPTGTEVWLMMDKGLGTDDIVEALRKKYDEKGVSITGSVKKLCREMADAGLIEEA